jgi:putative CRISPR-associated protein (TIGR02619 family)
LILENKGLELLFVERYNRKIMKRIITTVGTSLFSNSGKKIDYIENQSYQDSFFTRDTLDRIANRIKSLDNDVLAWAKKTGKNASAEISSLIQIQEQIQEPIEVHLICSYTILSRLAAEVIQKFFEERYDPEKLKYVKFEIHVVKNLQVTNKNTFKKGIKELFRVIGDDVVQKGNKGKRIWSEIIFNITGGYKSVVPYLNILAQLYSLDSYYVFNEDTFSSGYELIKLPSLPVNFDLSLFEDNYLAFELINEKKQDFPAKDEFLKYINESDFEKYEELYLIKEEDNKIRLAELGLLLYQAFEDSDDDFGFGRTNLIGKYMEVMVWEYLKHNKKDAIRVELGEPIGLSEKGDPFDIDVFVELPNEILSIEVKPHGVKLLKTGNSKDDKKTIEHKCEVGAFKCTFKKYPEYRLRNILLMYHHIEPASFHISNFRKLKFELKPLCHETLEFVWLKPEDNYKTNVNWKVKKEMLKKYDFENDKWIEFDL